MPQAATIRELSQIREANRFILDSIDNVTNTALGFKNGDGDPAVLIFVRRKIAEPWLPPAWAVPSRLDGPRDLFCPTDVISIESDRHLWLRTFSDDAGSSEHFPLSQLSSLVDTDRIEGANLRLRDGLRGAMSSLVPGSQLGYRTRDDIQDSGTLACFATIGRGAGQILGFLTNQHVGDFIGNVLFHPEFGGRPVAHVRDSKSDTALQDVYGAALAEGAVSTRLTVDAGFCTLAPDVRPLIDPRLPVLIDPATIGTVELGPEMPLDVDTMGTLGEAVLGVGASRGFQRGRVVAVGFDFLRGDTRSVCDYLIVGDHGREFSDGGDSGKLIVTADRHRPLAIMWGGLWARFSPDRGLENFTNATEIGRVLQILEAKIVRRL